MTCHTRSSLRVMSTSEFMKAGCHVQLTRIYICNVRCITSVLAVSLTPNVIANCCRETKDPRILALDISAIYIGTTCVREPAARPVTALPVNRPTSKSSARLRGVAKQNLLGDVAPAWSELPTRKITALHIMPIFRPICVVVDYSLSSRQIINLTLSQMGPLTLAPTQAAVGVHQLTDACGMPA